jgi:hypothetical protein
MNPVRITAFNDQGLMVHADLVTNAPGTPEKGLVLVRPPRSKTGDKVYYYDEHGIDLQRATKSSA